MRKEIIDDRERIMNERLTPAAIGAFVNILEKWRVSDENARQLLGGVSNGAFEEMKARSSETGAESALDTDRLQRISLLIGIFKSLNVLHDETLADRWIHLPNANRIFDGRTPLAFMIEGGIPAMHTVRRLLEARCSGC